MLRIGHRGAKGHYRDNSVNSIKNAALLGCDIIEVDVALTRDDIFVLWHDNKVQTFLMDEGKEVCDMSYVDMVLEDVCTLNKGLGLMGDALAYLDMKIPESKKDDKEYIRRYGDMLIDFLEEEDEQMIILASFNGYLISYLRGKVDNYFLGKILMLDEEMEDLDVDLMVFDYRDGRLSEYVGGDVGVFVYTVNGEDDIERMRGLGVNGVVSDYPERVRK